MKNHWVIAMAFATMLGCGSAEKSGLDGNKLVIDLSTDELDQFCAYKAEVLGAERTFECADGTVVTIAGVSKADCIVDTPTASSNPDCAATVGEAETCFEAFAAADPCNGYVDECAPVDVAECN